MSYNAITNLQEVVLDEIIANTATIDTATIQSLDCNVGTIDTLNSTTATITSANIPTITNTNLTTTGKIKSNVYTGTATSSNVSIGEAGDTGTTTLYKTINIPSLNASKIVLTDGFENLVSSSFTDTDFARLSENNIFSGSNNTIPTITNTNLTTTGKIKSNVYTGTATSSNLSIGETGDTGTTTLNKTIKIPSLNASKLVLTNGFDELISSSFTDTEFARLSADNIFTGSNNTIPTITNTNLTSSGKIKSNVYTGTATSSNLSIGEAGDTGTTTLYKTIKIDSLNPSKLVLTDPNDNLVSSSFTDSDFARLSADNIFSGSNNTIPTITNTNLTSSGKIKSNVYTGTTTSSNISIGETGDTGTTTLYKTIKIPSLNALKIVLTNGFDELVSSSFTDVDLAPLIDPSFMTKITTPDIVLVNSRVSLGESQTTTGLTNGILLGRSLSNNTHDNVIMLNASGTLYSANGASRFFVNPIRNVALTSGVLLYDASSKEVGYSLSPTLTSITSGSATITGLTASRAVLTDGSDNLVSATFNLPTNSGTSSFILTTNGASSTSWANPVGLPISSATQTALDQKAPLASPTFTGIATFPDIVLNNTRISLGSSQTTSGLTNGVMIGSNLSNNLFVNNVMLNGTGTTIISGGASRLYIAPIRNIGLTSGVLLYDSGSKEVSYSATPTLTSITAGSATITGLSANRAVLTDINDALTTTTFNLPTTSGTSGYVLRTDGVATTSWVDLASQSAITAKANIASPTFTGQVVVPKGSATSPSIAFGSTDLNTGIYSPFDDTFAVALNGVQKLVMTTTTFEPKDVIKAITGTNTAPCFTFQADANSGLYQSSVNNLDLAVNQVQKVNISQTLFHSKNNIQMTSASTDTWLTHGSGNTLFKTTALSGKYITSSIYAGAQTDTWSVLETNAKDEASAFCQNGQTAILINPCDSDALWFQDEDNMTTATNYAHVGWRITLAGVLVASSDRRLKRDINKIEKENLLDSLLDVNIVKYKMKPPSQDKLYKNGVLRKKYQQEHMGVIGQNIKKNFPDVVDEQDNGDEEKLISVKYQDLSYYFHLGTQELIRKVQALEDSNRALSEENRNLKTEVEKIKTFLNIQ